ncbi:MAG: hypothetical protein IPG45_24800 [Deltaproteobacteria bacterium]|nr:hypothetical protein [Deltaproteobacteria bacterium]MBK6687717.1 hypothetical protein [Deltaproteobacteria bacterium]
MSLAKPCRVDAGGQLLEHDVGRLPRLAAPLCFVHSSTSATVLALFDGNFVEMRLGFDSVRRFTKVAVAIPLACDRSSPFVRHSDISAEFTGTTKDSVGHIDRIRASGVAHVVCGQREIVIVVEVDGFLSFSAAYAVPPRAP